jgi:hypothetical protein
MKQGMEFNDLLKELSRQAEAKRDFRTPTTKLLMHGGENLSIDLKDNAVGYFGVSEHTHNQIGTRLAIPAKFYDRLRKEQPDMLDYNVNELFRRKPETRMVRTLDGKARAFLSDRYARRDNWDLVQAITGDLYKAKQELGLVIESCQITERKLYIKFVTPKIEADVKPGDTVQAGGVISNSEIGEGYATAYPFVKRLICVNGMIIEDYGQRKAHIGKRVTAEEEAMEIYSDETLAADDHAFWLKIRDTMRLVLQPERFNLILSKLRESAGVKIESNPEDVVEELGNRYVLDSNEQKEVLRNLIDGGVGLTKWGLANAITSTAEKSESYDRATELEKLGGTIIDLSPADWKMLAVSV